MAVAEVFTARGDRRIALDAAAIATLASTFRGQLIRPGDPAYDSARMVWNGLIDKRPALIARCVGTADVVVAVKFARQHDLLVAVRGGGHNVAGNAVCNGGLVIDLSPMKGILVDPVKQTARAQPGVTWGELDRETQRFALATPGGEVSTTGIAGYTLSGGLGLLQRKWGLACDNLLSVEIVTADGEVRQSNVLEHPDLFWAVRGGGGNFGIVTWFEYQLHPLGPEIYAAATIYSLDNGTDVLRAWRDFTQQAPDEVTSEALLWSMPPFPFVSADLHGAPIVVLAGLYAGESQRGEPALQPLREAASPLLDLSGRSSYSASQSAFDELFPAGLLYYWKSLYLDALRDDTIDEIVALAADRPSPQSLIAIRHLGGAVGHVPEDATAYAHRRAAYNLSLDATWDDPNQSERTIAWTRRAWAELRDGANGGVYLNFAGLGEENDLLAQSGYGRNLERLRQIKRRYDPTNLFRGNINIAP